MLLFQAKSAPGEKSKPEAVIDKSEETKDTEETDSPIDGPVDRAEDECTLPPTPMTISEKTDTSKPAIVGTVGTLAPVAMTHRPLPPAKPKTRLRRRPPAQLQEDMLYGKYDEAIDTIDEDDGKTRSQASSAYTVSSIVVC